MKILIKESQYKVLLEQGFEMMEPTTDAYNEIVDGAKYWMGTDKTKILKAFDYIKNVQDFKTLISMFKDKRTGYGSFEEMINKEYDRQDFKDIIKLRDKLYSIGVILNFNSGNSIAGNPLFLEGVKISYVNNTPKTPQPKTTNKYLQQVPKACSSKWQPQLEKAKNYWIQWLSSPITKNKFLNNWKKVEKNMTSVEVENIFKKYLDSLKGLKLYYYNSQSSNAYAYVTRSTPEKIYVNCSQNDPDPYGSLIHEMQHLLYNIKPLNPKVQIANVFVNSNTEKSTPETFFKGNSNSNDDNVTNKMVSVSKQFGTTFYNIEYILFKAKNHEKKDPGYACRETEKMSNITSIRNLFGVKPGQNITKEMLLPYIKGEKDHTDVGWILDCWALSGFPDLNKMLNKMNQLAYQNTNQNNDSNTRTV
jgi:hypothetical protein